MKATEHTVWEDGIHKLEWEPPDIFHVYVNGYVSMDEAKMSVGVLSEEVVPACNDGFYIVTHIAPGAPGYSPKVRKYIASSVIKYKGSVVVGGGPIARASANIMIRAMQLMNLIKVPVRMVETDGEMYAIINEWRAAEKAGAVKG